MDALWKALKHNERVNVIERGVRDNPGIFPSCMGREMGGVPCCGITPYTTELEKAGVIVRVRQKMSITAGVYKGRQIYTNIRVDRLYPAGKVPDIDYENDVFEPSFTSACTKAWYYLSPKEKMDVIIREIKAKGDLGLTLDSIAKRIGMSSAITARWVSRLENAGLVEQHAGDSNRGEYYTVTWNAIRSRSSVGPGVLAIPR